MAAMSSLKNLPAGFRLNPQDEDLINFFLMRKLQDISHPDGNCFIHELDIYKYEPRDLIALFDNMASIKSNGLECFFFSHLYKDPNRRCNMRKIAEGKKGFWHQTGEGRKPQDNDKHKWAKRIFCHRLGTHRNATQTNWVMHEFRLISDERFVLCRITKRPKKKFSASAGKKRKVGFTGDSESHQEASLESCVLNDIITKKPKNYTVPSQNDNQSPQAAVSKASVHINATEDLIMAPLSDIITLEDLDMPLSTTIDELLRPLSDIIPPYYNSELFPNGNTIGVHTPPLVISSISDYGWLDLDC